MVLLRNKAELLQGVKIFDMKQRRVLTFIPRSASPGKSVRPELFPAHLVWQNDQTLLVGWSNDIKVSVWLESVPVFNIS